MKKARFGQLIAFASACALSVLIALNSGAEKQEAPQSGGDLISIEAMRSFGRLELPPVLFSHDAHTEVLGSAKEDCLTCHVQRQGRLIYKFKRESVDGRKAAQDLYHSECIGCHQERSEQAQKTGPLDGSCRSCHLESDGADSQQPFAMDKSLHFKHIQAYENDCGQCHHLFDEASGRLIYREKEELGCRACHADGGNYPGLDDLQQRPPENLFGPSATQSYLESGEPFSLKQASHFSCVQCHLDEESAGRDSGPVDCSGCHSLQGQAAVERLEEVPRLERNQPDAALITVSSRDLPAAGTGKPAGKKLPSMQPVLFDHKSHELSTDSCRVCHHTQRLQPCSECHSLTGREKGGQVTLEQAAHNRFTKTSCRGCHRGIVKEEPECSGCHSQMGLSQESGGQDCRVCHTDRAPGQAEVLALDPEAERRLAEDLLQDDQSGSSNPLDLRDVPQSVSIDSLENLYGPVDLPHKQIIQALQEGMAHSSLADAFHQSPETICQGCHHHSPPSANPPQCFSCHKPVSQDSQPDRPALKVAYHAQCMECHTQMGVDEPANTDCSACHEPKKDRAVSDLE